MLRGAEETRTSSFKCTSFNSEATTACACSAEYTDTGEEEEDKEDEEEEDEDEFFLGFLLGLKSLWLIVTGVAFCT